MFPNALAGTKRFWTDLLCLQCSHSLCTIITILVLVSFLVGFLQLIKLNTTTCNTGSCQPFIRLRM